MNVFHITIQKLVWCWTVGLPTLTLDLWVLSIGCFPANVAITAYWIDAEFVLNEALLTFQQIKGSHTGIHLAEVVYDALDRYGLCNNLFCITSDNASNNDRMYVKLATLLFERQGVAWDECAMHIRSMNHTINLAVQAFLKDLKVLQVRKCPSDDTTDDNYNSEPEDGDEDVDHDEEFDEEAMFMTTLSKLRSIAKVCLVTLYPCIAHFILF